MHKLLKRQMQKCLGNASELSADMKQLLNMVSETYDDYDQDRELTERSFELSTKELRALHKKLHDEAALQRDVISKLSYILHAYDDYAYNVEKHEEEQKDITYLIDAVVTLLDERKNAQRSANENRKILQNVIENIPCQVFWKDAQGVYLGCNGNFARYVGFENSDAVCGKSDVDLPWEDAVCSYITQRDATVLREGRVELNMEELRTGDAAHECVLLTSIVPVRDKEDNIVGLVGIQNDITELKVNERQVQELNKRLQDEQNVFFQGNVVLFKWRNEEGWPIEYVSRNVENVFGYTAEEFMSGDMSYVDIVHSDDRSRVAQEVAVAIAQELPHFKHEDYRVIRKNGDVIHLLDYTTVIRNEQGNITHFYGYVLNISDLIEATAQAREEKTRAELLYHVVPSAIFTVDTHRIITSWNKRAEEITGYTAEEVLGRPCNEFSVEPCEERCALFDQALSGDVFGEERKIRRKDGALRTISKNICYLRDGDGNVIGGIESFEDISEKKQAEKELIEYRQHLQQLVEQRTEELHKSNVQLTEEVAERIRVAEELEVARDEAQAAVEAKGQFLANVSHEIRTPMNSIIGFSEVIRDSIDIDIIHKHAETILNESEILLNLINTILDHAKIDMKSVDFEEEVFDIHEYMSIIRELFVRKSHEKKIALEIYVADAVPRVVHSDPLRLRQVLINLVDNALKFTHEGKVTISLDSKIVAEDRGLLTISVADTGIGIPKDRIHAIFDDFVQADGSTTRKYGGTGLGTSIARRIVEMLGGELRVESTPNVGSIFSFTIPVGIGVREQLEDSAVEITKDTLNTLVSSMQGPVRILLAEDYEPNQLLIQQHLKGVDIFLDIVHNGEEAIAYAQEKRYALIFMDIQMPVIDGYLATKKIRAQSDYNSLVPIIAMTANADTASQRACKEVGMNMILTKPIRKYFLYKTIHQWLGTDEKRVALNGTSASITPGDMPLRYEEILEEFDNDSMLLNQVITQFLKQGERQIESIKAAIVAGDAEVVRRESHKLRGGAANLTADSVAEAARILEEIAEAGDVCERMEEAEKLDTEFKRVKEHIARRVQ